MTSLNPSTIRRLQNLPQVPSVWEGDRRSLALSAEGAIASNHMGDCILWVDGTDAVIRSMNMVTADAGLEAVARTLLKAFEHPHGGGDPMRPTKIVVCDREIQFFLRGVLQELDISVEHVSDLPLINEIFNGLQASLTSHVESEQPYGDVLEAAAYTLWDDAPWNMLSEEKIIAIHLNRPDVETFYISVLGMLGVEYGALMYRTPQSLKQFRQRVLTAKQSPEALEEAFLQQDCLFITFEQASEYDIIDTESDFDPLDMGDRLSPSFGNLHPLEGMRPHLYEEEAISAILALEALHRFIQQHKRQLNRDMFPAINSRYRIPSPANPAKKMSIQVETLPDLADELAEMTDDVAPRGMSDLRVADQGAALRDDLVPENSMYSLGAIPWDLLELMRPTVKFHQSAGSDFPTKSDGLPVILIQTSRPKALTMIEDLKAFGGLKSILFSAGEDPFSNISYDLGILQTNDGTFHLFGEFGESDPVHIQARKKWDQRCKKTKGYCGLVIAMGLTGASRGNPQLKDMMALFEVKTTSADELGLGTLQRSPNFDFSGI